MMVIKTWTKFEVTDQKGNVRQIACETEEGVLDGLNLKKQGDYSDINKHCKIVVNITAGETFEKEVGDPLPDPIYGNVKCRYCDMFPQRRINQQPAMQFVEGGLVLVEPPAMVDYVYYDYCGCGMRHTAVSMEIGS